MGNKIKAVLCTLIIQMCFIGLFFFGSLLDPLIGLWVAGIYFFVIGSYLMYHCLLTSLFRAR